MEILKAPKAQPDLTALTAKNGRKKGDKNEGRMKEGEEMCWL